MSMPTYQQVTVKLPLNRCKRLDVAPWDNLVAVDKSDFYVTNLNYLGFSQGW